MSLTALEKIKEIQSKAEQEIKDLKQQAVSEIARKLADAKSLIKDLEVQYADLTGKNVRGESVAKRPVSNKASITNAKDLSELLSKAPGKKLNRKGFLDAGFSLKSALVVAKADPKTFGVSQNGPQGEIWLK